MPIQSSDISIAGERCSCAWPAHHGQRESERLTMTTRNWDTEIIDRPKIWQKRQKNTSTAWKYNNITIIIDEHRSLFSKHKDLIFFFFFCCCFTSSRPSADNKSVKQSRNLLQVATVCQTGDDFTASPPDVGSFFLYCFARLKIKADKLFPPMQSICAC